MTLTRALLPLAMALVASATATARRSGEPMAPVTVRVVATPAATPATAAAPRASEEPASVLARRVGAELGAAPACVVVRDGRRTVLSLNPEAPLTPASTQKLLVGVAALSALGAGYRFETKGVAAAPRDGAVEQLWLVGSGDPGLSTPEYAAFRAGKPRWRDLPSTPLAELADRLVGAGVSSVGAIHGDESRHEATRYVATWKQDYIKEAEIPPLSALELNGGWRSWTPRREPAAEPAAHAAAELGRLLTERGVVVGPSAGVSAAPAGAVELASVSSAPLADIVAGMLRSSDNLTAELLTRELGAGSTAGGARAVVDRLRKIGVPTEGVSLVDGSGLDGGNRATCRALVDALDWRAGSIVPRLAVAGETGTLVRRTAFRGRLRAKTGWIDGSAGMVGVLEAGRPLRFALLLNGVLSYRAGNTVEDRVLRALADYGRAP